MFLKRSAVIQEATSSPRLSSLSRIFRRSVIMFNSSQLRVCRNFYDLDFTHLVSAGESFRTSFNGSGCFYTEGLCEGACCLHQRMSVGISSSTNSSRSRTRNKVFFFFFCHFLLFNDNLFLTALPDDLSAGGGTSASHNDVDTKRNQKGVVTFKHKLLFP